MVEKGRSGNNGTERVITERKGHITDMTLPVGGLRIIYGAHSRPIDPVDIPKGTKGIFLEAMNPPRSGYDFFRHIAHNAQYSRIVRHANKNEVPIYFHDVGASERYANYLFAAGVLKLAEPLAVIPVIASSSSFKEGLLRSTPIIYDLLSPASVVGRKISSQNPDKDAALARGLVKTHPYTSPVCLRMRNAIWAEKLKWAMENLGDEGDHYTTVVGAEHVGLEKYMRKVSSGDRPKILRATRSIWGRIGDIKPFYSITRFDPDSSAAGGFKLGEVFEVPELKALAGVV
ncbi:MAG TPA: hypothetical protein VM077_02655 [Candidatus Limnocylindrales bacterium]|nr:hypothetical protein [Candidatus Limnocylindrales bacterium]